MNRSVRARQKYNPNIFKCDQISQKFYTNIMKTNIYYYCIYTNIVDLNNDTFLEANTGLVEFI